MSSFIEKILLRASYTAALLLYFPGKEVFLQHD